MSRGVAAVVVAVVIGACTFDSATPFFTEIDGVTPIADGVRYAFLEHKPGAEENEESEIPQIVFRRRGGAYALVDDNPGSASMAAIFVPVPETAEDDYVVQIAIESGEGRAYAFVWRSGDTYKLILAPGALDDFPAAASALPRFCTPGQLRSCAFANRDSLIAFYRNAIYPAFVAPDVDFHGLAYLVPSSTDK